MSNLTSQHRPASPGERSRYRGFETRPHTLPELLKLQAQREHAGPAVVAADGTMTFAEWATRAAQGAGVLAAHGVRPGVRVGLWGSNQEGANWIAALLAIQWAGGVPVPLNDRTPLSGTTARLKKLGAPLVVAGSGRTDLGEHIEVLPLDLWRQEGSPLADPIVDPNRASSIFHTSGTTGPPKAALISHEALAYAASMTEEYILAPPCGVDALSGRDIIQTSVPLFTSSALVHFIVLSLWTGCGLVCEPSFDAEETVRTARRHGSTIWLTVPAMMVLVSDRHPEPLDDLPLRAVWHMGSVATAEAISETRRVFPAAAVLNLYSLTETAAGMVVSHADDAATKPGCSGRPTATTRIRVVRDDGSEADPGEVGEVQFESPCMFDGYDGDAAATARFYTSDGWARSGDGGALDSDGTLWVTGRLGDVIVRGGLKVNPVVVEQLMTTFPQVTDAVIVPVPHRVLGHDIIGLVVGNDLDVQALRRHCLEQLPSNEVPRTMLTVAEIPRNEFGKLNRRAAASLAAQLLQRADDGDGRS
jgi:acyl-CoA synthetase (AMP-forming)/AMP-acid ligase II